MKRKLISIIAIIMLIAGMNLFSINATGVNVSGNNITAEAGKTITVKFTTSGVSSSTPLYGLEASLNGVDNRLVKISGPTLSVSGAIEGENVISYTDPNGAKSNLTISITYKIEDNATADTINVPMTIKLFLNPDGTNPQVKNVTAKVTIQDTSTPSTGGDQPSNNKSNDATLKNLKVGTGSFTPSFSKNTTNYKMKVNPGVKSIKVTATPNSSKAICKVSGNTNLKDGTNIIKVVVTAENGDQKTYKITVTKLVEEDNGEDIKPNIEDENTVQENNVVETSGEQETDVLGLSSLIIQNFELIPTFRENVYAYTLTVPNDIENLEITALANQEDTTIEVIGNTQLQQGENVVTVLVHSKDGTETTTYQILVTKSDTNQITEEQEKAIFAGWTLKQLVQLGIAAVVLFIIIVLIIIYFVKNKNSKIESKRMKESVREPKEEIKQNLIKTDIQEEKSKEDKNNKNGKRFK